MNADETDHVKPSGRRSRPGGRAARVVAAVHAATADLLFERGYRELGIPAIAKAAKINSASIYRRWSGKEELVLDVARAWAGAEAPIPDTGNLASDLALLLRAIADVLASPFGEGLLHALIDRGTPGAALECAGTAFWDARFLAAEQVVKQAVRRGELPAHTDARQLLELAASPLFLRRLLKTDSIADAQIDVLARRAIAAFTA